MAVLTISVSILDYIVPASGAKKSGASKFAVWGSIIGIVIGIFFPPFGIFIGGFIGALAGELLTTKKAKKALQAGWGVFVGIMLSTVIKLVFCGVMLFFYIKKMFS